MRNILLLLALLLAPAFANAQTGFRVYKETALSAAAEVITLQQPSTGAFRTTLGAGSVYCSVVCDITLEINGTAASTTAQTPVNLDVAATQASAANAFNTSNVGTGTVIGKYTLSAGQILPLDLSKIRLPKVSTTATNFTIRTSSITGTVRIGFTYYQEPQP